jgi:RHS repeat-associated protein
MFGARYYGSSLGRFMTPDWAAKPISVPYAEFGDPQTLNLYGYVRNNPLSKADADGHCYPWCTVLGGAIIGGVIGGGGEIIAAKLHGQSIDWKKVEGSAVKGAVTGAAIGLAGPEAGVAATAALGAGGNVAGGIADRTIQGQSAKEVLSPTEVAKDAASGAVGGAIGGAKVGEAAGEFVAQGSAKVAAASGDQAAANFYSSNASAIGTGVAKAIDVGQSTAESYHGQTNQQQQQQQQPQQQRTQCADKTSCH